MHRALLPAAGMAILGIAGLAILSGTVPSGLGSGQLAPTVHVADFNGESVSADARQVADWVAVSRDAAGGPFVIVDKKSARIHVFDGAAKLRASSAVLLGAARGDESLAGSNDKPIGDLRREERITPAGRFVASRGRNQRGEDVVWVDYDESVSMHRVLTAYPKERRLERLATPTADDNRISYGCINVPAAFYEAHVRPMFASQDGVVYVLPDVRTLQQVFGSYEFGAGHAVVRTMGQFAKAH